MTRDEEERSKNRWRVSSKTRSHIDRSLEPITYSANLLPFLSLRRFAPGRSICSASTRSENTIRVHFRNKTKQKKMTSLAVFSQSPSVLWPVAVETHRRRAHQTLSGHDPLSFLKRRTNHWTTKRVRVKRTSPVWKRETEMVWNKVDRIWLRATTKKQKKNTGRPVVDFRATELSPPHSTPYANTEADLQVVALIAASSLPASPSPSLWRKALHILSCAAPSERRVFVTRQGKQGNTAHSSGGKKPRVKGGDQIYGSRIEIVVVVVVVVVIL